MANTSLTVNLSKSLRCLMQMMMVVLTTLRCYSGCHCDFNVGFQFVDMMMRFLNQIGRLRPGQRQTDMYDPVPSDILGSADLDMEPSDLKVSN